MVCLKEHNVDCIARHPDPTPFLCPQAPTPQHPNTLLPCLFVLSRWKERRTGTGGGGARGMEVQGNTLLCAHHPTYCNPHLSPHRVHPLVLL